MFFRKKDASKTVRITSKVYEAWQFTRENLNRADSWVRIHPNNIHLTSQYGGEVIWIELSGCREKVYPGDWIVLQEGIGFFAISDKAKRAYWQEVIVP